MNANPSKCTLILSLSQLAIPSLLSTANRTTSVLCREWRKCAGIQRNVFSFIAWLGGEATWITDQTLFNSDYCWNTELPNTHFDKNMSLTAALKLQMSTSSPQSCTAKGKIPKTISRAKKLHCSQNGKANRSGPASDMHTSSKLRNTQTFGCWETQEISWHLIQALSAHAPIMSLVPAQTIASTRLVLTPLNTSANILFSEQKYNHISHLVVLKGLNHIQQTTQAWMQNGRNC